MNFYHKLISDLEEHLYKLHPEAKLVYETINGFRSMVDAPDGLLNPDSPLVYDIKLTVIYKIMFALKYSRRFIKMSDINRIIKSFEPDFKKGLSTPLQKLKKQGGIISINTTGSNKTVYYGLVSWCGENGKIKEEYMKI